jgi:hypothetical protein
MMKKSQITFLIAIILLVATLAPVCAVPILAERSVDMNTVKGSMDSTDGKAGSIADARANITSINASMGNISQSIDVMRVGQYKLTYYEQVLSKSEQVVTNVSQLGIDTSAMKSVISSARSGVLNPLKSALDSGDITRVTNELKTKCLNNGTSYSYHYGSKMDLEMMKAVTAKIERIVTIAGYGTEIKEVKTHLDNAEKTIDKVGTRPYTQEEMKYIATELKDASVALVEIIQSMNEKAGH